MNEMIPKRPDGGCPSGTYNSQHTCFCEDHCNWDTCRLHSPPYNCLSGINEQTVWAWDGVKSAWVAQGIIIKILV